MKNFFLILSTLVIFFIPPYVFGMCPTQHVAIYSNQVSNYLHQLPPKNVDVTFGISSDFGCFRGFNEKQIGQLTSWKFVWGYASVDHSIFRPNPWWCP